MHLPPLRAHMHACMPHMAQYLLVLELYAACPAAAPAACPIVSTLRGSTELGLRGWRVQKPGGCHMLLVLPWYIDSCSTGPPMISPTWSMNSSRYPSAALVACTAQHSTAGHGIPTAWLGHNIGYDMPGTQRWMREEQQSHDMLASPKSYRQQW
jgi:hypothetical protein